jgi:hypothetical protein
VAIATPFTPQWPTFCKPFAASAFRKSPSWLQGQKPPMFSLSPGERVGVRGKEPLAHLDRRNETL